MSHNASGAAAISKHPKWLILSTSWMTSPGFQVQGSAAKAHGHRISPVRHLFLGSLNLLMELTVEGRKGKRRKEKKKKNAWDREVTAIHENAPHAEHTIYEKCRRVCFFFNFFPSNEYSVLPILFVPDRDEIQGSQIHRSYR